MANTSVSALSGLLGYCVLVQEKELGIERGLGSLEMVRNFVRAVLFEDATYVSTLFIESYVCRREVTLSHSELPFSWSPTAITALNLLLKGR